MTLNVVSRRIIWLGSCHKGIGQKWCSIDENGTWHIHTSEQDVLHGIHSVALTFLYYYQLISKKSVNVHGVCLCPWNNILWFPLCHWFFHDKDSQRLDEWHPPCSWFKTVARGTCHDCHDTPNLQVIENDDLFFCELWGPTGFTHFLFGILRSDKTSMTSTITSRFHKVSTVAVYTVLWQNMFAKPRNKE